MPRKNRIWYPGATYHVMGRGNHKQDIFMDEQDRLAYLANLRATKERYEFNLYSYCLMTNHVHLQIQTKDIDISTIMKRINMNYTIYFNKKYDLVGHLFQGRYRSELIYNDIYNLEVSRYIHLNPVRAQMVMQPQDYPWSSYQNYMGEKQDKLVSTDAIMRYFKGDPLLYQNYVEYDLIER